MSVIQKIRDKYARIAVIAIALALLGFIMMDAFAGRSRLFGGNESTIGKINGKKIDAQTFQRRVSDIVKRQGPNAQQDVTQQVVNELWQQEVSDEVMGEQYKELGLTVSDKELDATMFSPTPSQVVLQAFGVQNPQQWDPAQLRQTINQIKKSGTAEQKQQLTETVDYLEKQILMSKYIALLANSSYFPKWFLEKRNVDNSQMAKAAYVSVPYTSIADSTVKVTDAEIEDYLKAHKKDYEQKEESRSISYVQFSAAPSSADSAAVREKMLPLKDSFQHTSNVKDFLINNRSLAQYNDSWISAKDLQLQNSDSIFKAPVGSVSGPFVEQGAYLLVKILDKKTQPDTAKVRHILIGLNDPQTGTPLHDSVTAKRIADSVKNVIASGVPFDSVVMKVSDDPGKLMNRGVYDSITRTAQLVPEFKDFALNNPVGTKGVVKSQFGYHYMEVLNQRGSSPVYKAAFFVLPIEASAETQTNASNAATMFAGNAKDEKSFKEYFDKNIKGKKVATTDAPLTATVRPMEYNLPGVQGSARELIRDVFKASKGDVLNPISIGSNFIVAVVTDVSEPGLPSASAARQMVEPILLNKKKADKIKSQIGKVTDLNTIASKFNQQVQTADSIRFSGAGPLGFEGKVIGAMFNPANKGKVCEEPIAGQMGVYAIRVDNTFTGAVENANIEQQRQMLEMQSRQQMGSPLELLQKRANIKDYRAKFY
ncbi:peptidylprolyl isomerase [Flavisolibacter ginsenosidimutans]|uniref:Peptidylprolyl isomerase n=1 Tax=Flavisolibacter ginsenosidimutans TaxID=661481 RepID=A0A5B8UMQ5_9BACT|nr:peptidylprolyl isomerase [Flavisolibacter ginsenosidimutans]QEC57285.1 peptidylprolyl isomerase [Flavisolibacter ginsenosidimutans]